MADVDGPWLIWVCPGCGAQIIETYEYLHDEHPGDAVQVEVAPRSMLDATQQQLDQLLEAVRGIRESGDARHHYRALRTLHDLAEEIERAR